MLGLGCALTSSLIGGMLDAQFPSEIPEEDHKLVLYSVGQLGLGLGIYHELYTYLLSFRDMPPTLGDGLPIWFLLEAQPNLTAKISELQHRIRARFTAPAVEAGEVKAANEAHKEG